MSKNLWISKTKSKPKIRRLPSWKRMWTVGVFGWYDRRSRVCLLIHLPTHTCAPF